MIIKKPIIILVVAVVLLLIVGFFTGIIPGLQLFDNGTNTVSITVEEIVGNKNYELLGPQDKKGYILSWKDDGFSESITVRGKIESKTGEPTLWGIASSKYMYKVYLKKDSWSSYELISQPGSTSRYINNPNPGKVNCGNTNFFGFQEQYEFNIVGNDYAGGAIKAELWFYYDKTIWDGDGYKWYKIASDEAYLYSGYGELILPRGIDDEDVQRPYDTFEIGQTVKIGVGTGKGGHGGDNHWRVTLNAPYGGVDSLDDLDGDNPEKYGTVIKEKYYPDDCDSSNTFFTFTVTEDMARRSMESEYPFTVRIWNTLLPKGTLNVDFVDFVAKCPSDVTFSGDNGQFEVDKYVTVQMTADVNSGTQAEIDYIRCSVVYGTADTLLPSSQTSDRWIVYTTNLGGADKTGCTLPQSITFKAEKASYVTVFAKAFDIEGRGSPGTYTRQMYAWKDSEPPDDTTDTGDDYYGGGHTEDWLPWDPSGGNWELVDNDGSASTLLKIILSIVLIAMFAVIVYFFPIPGGIYGKMLLMMLGVGLIVVIWMFL